MGLTGTARRGSHAPNWGFIRILDDSALKINTGSMICILLRSMSWEDDDADETRGFEATGARAFG